MQSEVIATLLAQRTLQVIRLYWKRWKDADVANTNAAWHTRWLERQTILHRKCSYVQAIPSSATGGALVSYCMRCWLGSHLLWLILPLKLSTRYCFPYSQPMCVQVFNVFTFPCRLSTGRLRYRSLITPTCLRKLQIWLFVFVRLPTNDPVGVVPVNWRRILSSTVLTLRAAFAAKQLLISLKFVLLLTRPILIRSCRTNCGTVRMKIRWTIRWITENTRSTHSLNLLSDGFLTMAVTLEWILMIMKPITGPSMSN